MEPLRLGRPIGGERDLDQLDPSGGIPIEFGEDGLLPRPLDIPPRRPNDR